MNEHEKLKQSLVALYKDLTDREYRPAMFAHYRQKSELICHRIDLHEKMAIQTGQWQRAGQMAFEVISKL